MKKSKTLLVFFVLIMFLVISLIISFPTAEGWQKATLAGSIVFFILLYKLLK